MEHLGYGLLCKDDAAWLTVFKDVHSIPTLLISVLALALALALAVLPSLTL